ncbi:MAG: enoyl-CoA hydratase [Usitatibacter sp.]
MDILVSRDGPILEIEFNRPQRRNAITAQMYTLLSEAFERAEADPSVRVILIHGQSEGAFTAGNDIDDFVQRPPLGDDTPVFRFLRTMSGAAKPIVAAVNGPAVGIGTTLLLHCDLVYVGDNARFQLPFASLGVVPEFASSYLLPLVAGYQRAAELLLLGEPFGAEKAREAGFVTRVSPSAETLGHAREAAMRIAALPEKSVRLTKALMKQGHGGAVQERLLAEGKHFRAMLQEPAAREALAAFMEKRKPDFTRNNS